MREHRPFAAFLAPYLHSIKSSSQIGSSEHILLKTRQINLFRFCRKKNVFWQVSE